MLLRERSTGVDLRSPIRNMSVRTRRGHLTEVDRRDGEVLSVVARVLFDLPVWSCDQRLRRMGEDNEDAVFVGARSHHCSIEVVVESVGWIKDDPRALHGQSSSRLGPAPVGADHDPEPPKIRIKDVKVSAGRVLVVVTLEVQLVVGSDERSLAVEDEC